MLIKRKLGFSNEGHKLNKLYTRKKYIRNKEGFCKMCNHLSLLSGLCYCYYKEPCFAWRDNKFCYVPD